MSNIIKIKRSTTTAQPASLQAGELAYSFNSQKLFVGNTTNGVIAIGGKLYTDYLNHTPGTTTASAALIADANSHVSAINTTNLKISTSGGAGPTLTSVLTDVNLTGASNTSLATSGAVKAYIDAAGAAGSMAALSDTTITAPANGHFLVYDTGRWRNKTASGDLTLTETGNFQIATGVIVDADVNASAAIARSKLANGTANHVVINGAGGEFSSEAQLALSRGGTASNLTAAAGAIAFSNATAIALTAAGTSGQLLQSAGTGTPIWAAQNTINANSAVQLATSRTIAISGPITGTATGFNGTANITIPVTALNVGAAEVTGTLALARGGSNSSITAAAGAVAFSNATGFALTAAGTSGQVLTSAGTGTPTWTTATNTNTASAIVQRDGSGNFAAGTITAALTGNATTATTLQTGRTIAITGPVTGTATSFNGSSNISIPVTAINLGAAEATGTVAVARGGTGLGTTPTNGQVLIGNGTGYTLAAITGTASQVAVTNGAGSIQLGLPNDVNIPNNLTVTGDLSVLGTLTTLDVDNIAIEDPLIKLAKNNVTADIVDIGFYGTYDPTGTKDLWTGLFRDATDGKYKLFRGLEVEPTTTVDIAGLGYARATLVADIESPNVTITGGSISGVTISSLASALGVASGGTGVTALTQNGVLYGGTTSSLAFATGTNFQVMQLNGSGVPVFADLDGGTF